MDSEKAQFCISQTCRLLRNGTDFSEFQECLDRLGKLVVASAQDAELRDAMATQESLDSLLLLILAIPAIDGDSEGELTPYVRLLRGAVLLLRNLVLSADSIDSASLFKGFSQLNSAVPATNSFFARCYIAYVELLANCASKFGSEWLNLEAMASHMATIGLDNILSAKDGLFTTPFNIFIACSFRSHNAAGALLLDSRLAPIMTYLSDVDLGEAQELIPVIQEVIVHEKFHTYIMASLEPKPARGAQFLASARLGVTEKEDWTNLQCLTILDWAFSIVKVVAPLVDVSLKSRIWDPEGLAGLHLTSILALDILADLGKFNCAQQFFLEYDVLDVVIPLFRVVRENTTIRDAKSSRQSTDKRFPVVASIIIEILATVCHGSFEAQEKIRELHGLELVLSSCVIDDDNPFMKERAILCLRFLLEKNQKNQEFVASLEAQNVADSSTLEAADYEVDLVDGKVQVKKKQDAT